MPLSRTTSTNRFLNLDFTMLTPSGFVEASVPAGPADFAEPHACTPILALHAGTKAAAIDIFARPAPTDGSVRDWFQAYCVLHELRLLSIGPTYVGGHRKNHPAVMGAALLGSDRDERVMSFVVLEDGRRLALLRAACTRKLEPKHMRTLEKAIHSFELLHHQGPTMRLDDDGGRYDIEIIDRVPDQRSRETEAEMFARKLAQARDQALAKAGPLIASDRFDEAAAIVLAADDSGKARAALSSLFAGALERQVRLDGRRNPATPRALELFRRALQYRLSTYPDPHTQEEADRYGAGMDEDRAEITAILGYDPR